MSALDRAIIQAFHRPATSGGAGVAEPPTPALVEPLAPTAATNEAVPLSKALAEFEATMAPVGLSIASLLDDAIQSTVIATEPPITVQIDGAALPEAEATAAPSATTRVEAEAPRVSPPAYSAATAVKTNSAAWRPLLQVDRLIWPGIHGRLQSVAPAAVEQMTEGLSSLCASGVKIIGLTSCARGEGVTTLLAAAARRLAGQGRKVVIVDANGNNPQLAQSLGLLPQIGWEATLCGALPLEEVVIESLADGLAVLPVREPSAGEITKQKIVASLDQLAGHYDVVLVDLGPLDEGANALGSGLAQEAAARMDAVILVQNVRITPPNRTAEVRRRLAASNLRFAGTIQNFVAG